MFCRILRPSQLDTADHVDDSIYFVNPKQDSGEITLYVLCACNKYGGEALGVVLDVERGAPDGEGEKRAGQVTAIDRRAGVQTRSLR